ncbi:hypothetical protein TNCV_1731261 [Trichonephila clavipes]|nr:hypothetical protein TNCV_1731261 [Trichonephila clavipes]
MWKLGDVMPAQVSSSSLDHGSKLRGPSPKALSVKEAFLVLYPFIVVLITHCLSVLTYCDHLPGQILKNILRGCYIVQDPWSGLPQSIPPMTEGDTSSPRVAEQCDVYIHSLLWVYSAERHLHFSGAKFRLSPRF